MSIYWYIAIYLITVTLTYASYRFYNKYGIESDEERYAKEHASNIINFDYAVYILCWVPFLNLKYMYTFLKNGISGYLLIRSLRKISKRLSKEHPDDENIANFKKLLEDES